MAYSRHRPAGTPALNPRDAADLALALNYGTDLPTPPKLRLALPAFALGSASAMTFSPDGAWLVVPTANGTFLWDVAAGRKAIKLAVPGNPYEFVFAADGRELLVRNGQGQFVRLAIPSGDVVARFKAEERLRLDGRPAFVADAGQVLQLAANGRVLAIDAHTGATTAEHALDPDGCDGAVHWLADAGHALVVMMAVADAAGRNACTLWRWSPPFAANRPTRLPGHWDDLSTAWRPERGELLLHHRPRDAAPGRYVLEIVDAATLAPRRRVACGGIATPRPALAHDGGAWSVGVVDGVQIGIGEDVLHWPVGFGSAAFSPVADLVAVSGPLAVVAPRTQLPALLAAAQRQRDVDVLNQRGYARGMTWPGRQKPPRIVAWRGASGIAFEAEAFDGRRYVPHESAERAASAATDDVVRALDAAIARAHSASLPATPRDRRDFQAGALLPPPGDWSAGVAVTLATDAIDLWPLKRRKDGTFVQHWSPLAAIPAGTRGAALWTHILAMM